MREVIRLVASLLLLASGLLHVSHPHAFAMAIHGYGLTGSYMTAFLTSFLPLLQITIGIFLLACFMEELSFVFAAILFAVFSVVGLIALTRELEISCGCFGDYSPTLSWWHVLLTSVAALLCLWCAGLKPSFFWKRFRAASTSRTQLSGFEK